jgi:hypothetical protein
MPNGKKYVYIVLDTSSGGSTNVKAVYDKLALALKDVETVAAERNWELEPDSWTAYDAEDDGNIIKVEEKLIDDGKGLIDDPGDTGEVEDPDNNVEEDFSSIEDEEEINEKEN